MNKPYRFLFLLLFLFSSGLKAQREFTAAFQKGIFLLDLHSSLGLYRQADKNYLSARLPVFIGADYGLTNQISGGLFAGWDQRSYKPVGKLIYDVNYYYYGARFNFHMTEKLGELTSILEFDPQRVDIYAGIWAGRQDARELSFSGAGFKESNTANLFGIMLGTRIFTLYRVAFMVEVGACPYGVFNLGVATRI